MSITRSVTRDNYILAQALAIAIKVLEAEQPYEQRSNIADMKALLQATKMPVGVMFEREVAALEAAAPALQAAFKADWERKLQAHVKAKKSKPGA